MKHVKEYSSFILESVGPPLPDEVQEVINLLNRNSIEFSDDSTPQQRKNGTFLLTVLTKNILKILNIPEVSRKVDQHPSLRKKVDALNAIEKKVGRDDSVSSYPKSVYIYSKRMAIRLSVGGAPSSGDSLKYGGFSAPEAAVMILLKFAKLALDDQAASISQRVTYFGNPKEIIDDVYKADYDNLYFNLATNKNLSEDDLIKIITVILKPKVKKWRYALSYTAELLANHPNSSEKVIREMIRNLPFGQTVKSIAGSRVTPVSILLEILRKFEGSDSSDSDENHVVMYTLLRNENLPIEELERFAKTTSNRNYRIFLLENIRLSDETLAGLLTELAKSSRSDDRAIAARDKRTPFDLVITLSHDRDKNVAAAAKKNISDQNIDPVEWMMNQKGEDLWI